MLVNQRKIIKQVKINEENFKKKRIGTVYRNELVLFDVAFFIFGCTQCGNPQFDRSQLRRWSRKLLV